MCRNCDYASGQDNPSAGEEAFYCSGCGHPVEVPTSPCGNCGGFDFVSVTDG